MSHGSAKSKPKQNGQKTESLLSAITATTTTTTPLGAKTKPPNGIPPVKANGVATLVTTSTEIAKTLPPTISKPGAAATKVSSSTAVNIMATTIANVMATTAGPMATAKDTRQEIVENYLNSLHRDHRVPVPVDISSSLAEGEPSNMNGLTDPPWNGLNGGPRFRGVSVDRYRDYTTPQYYEDTYYRRDPYDSSGSGPSLGFGRSMSLGRTRGRNNHLRSMSYYAMEGDCGPREERTIFKLERQWSHPNLRPRPRGVSRDSRTTRRCLPQTPNQAPHNVIPSSPPRVAAKRQNESLIEWIEMKDCDGLPCLAARAEIVARETGTLVEQLTRRDTAPAECCQNPPNLHR